MNNSIREHAPCYVYDSSLIKENCQRLTSALPQVEFLYSIKTNPFEPIVRLVMDQGFGADAASAREVLKAEAAGIPGEKIFYSTPGKTKKDIESVYGKCIIIADSIHELELLNCLAGKKGERLNVGIRVNPRSAFASQEGPSKFGIDEEEITDQQLARFNNLTIAGIHIHMRSQVLDEELLKQYYERCYDTAVRINQLTSANISFINFGSGIGMVYDSKTQKPLDLAQQSQAFDQIQQRNLKELNAAFYLESGRFIVGNAGKYYMPIVDIKVSRGKKYLIVRNGANGFLRSAIANLLRKASGSYPDAGMEPFYTCENEIQVRLIRHRHETDTQLRVPDHNLELETHVPGCNTEQEIVSVVGNLCTAQDVICEDILLDKAEIGDLIEITNAGSYGYSLSPVLFASHEAPEEILI